VIIPLAPNIGYRLRRHLAIEPIASPAAHPHVPQSGGKPRPPSVVIGMKGNTVELRNESSLASFKMNILELIMQLVMLSEYVNSQTTSVGSDRPEEFADLNDGI
jgi:hypothetical protein